MISNGLFVSFFKKTAKTRFCGSFVKNSMQLVQLSGKGIVLLQRFFEFFSFWSDKLLKFGTMIMARF